MDLGEAELALTRMVAADQPPELDDFAVRDLALLAQARGWNLNAAAAEGWRWKAAKVAGEFGFSTDGNRFDRDQAHGMCMRMAQWYQQRAAAASGASLSAVTVRSPTAAAAAAASDPAR